MRSHVIMFACIHAGYPTNEERLIVGLGLGGSGQNIDSTSVLPPQNINSNLASSVFVNQRVILNNLKTGIQGPRSHDISHTNSIQNPVRKQDSGVHKQDSVYGNGTRCPQTNSAGEVCQNLSGMSMF